MDKLRQLFQCAMGKNIPAEFANENIDYEAALRDELRGLVGTRNLFMKNQYDLFALMTEAADEILPQKVEALVGAFADIRQFPNDARVTFKITRGRTRGKSYVTRATAAGVYETFRLDHELVELVPHAYGAGGIVDFERYLSGDEDIMEIFNIILEGLMDRIFEEIQGCMIQSWNANGRTSANKVSANGFDAAKMADLIGAVRAYGAPVIYCSPQFAATMANVISATYGSTNSNIAAKMSNEDIADFRNQGYIGMFAGAPVVVIPNSYADETNSKLVFNPCLAYVIPAGKEKVVKVALVGQQQFRTVDNADWSMEIQGYRKIAVGIVGEVNYWGMYYNSGIAAGGWDNSALV